jgi:hypothetical protein
MEISKDTIEVFKNFSNINNSIFNDEPGVLKTISPSTTIIGVCDIEEEFPEFAVYDLNELLGIVSLFSEADFDFKENFFTIKDKKAKVKYHFADPDHIPLKPKEAKAYKSFDDFQATIKLTEENISNIQKASNIMQVKTMMINLKDGKGKVTLFDPENPNTNNYETKVTGEGTVNVSVSVENLLLIDGDYTVNIAEGKAMKFNHDKLPLFYFISVLAE